MAILVCNWCITSTWIKLTMWLCCRIFANDATSIINIIGLTIASLKICVGLVCSCQRFILCNWVVTLGIGDWRTQLSATPIQLVLWVKNHLTVSNMNFWMKCAELVKMYVIFIETYCFWLFKLKQSPRY